MCKIILTISVFFHLLPVLSQQPDLYFRKINTGNGLSNNKVNCILQDKRGFIWIGTDDGLNRYDGNNFLVFRNIPGSASCISGNIITSLLEDEKELLWIGTADGGLSRYDYRLPAEKQFRQYKHNNADSLSIPVNIINAIVQDPSGSLWLATSGKRAIRFNKKNEQFDLPPGKGTTTAIALCIGPGKKLWVGRQGGGLYKVNLDNLAFEYDQRYDNLYAKLPHAVVTSLYRDKENNIWFGSWDKVLYKFNTADGTEEVFRQSSQPFSFLNDEIDGFAEDKQRRLWMAGHYNGLHVLDLAQNRFYNFRFDPAIEGTIADNKVNCVFIDKAGNLWVGTNRGISTSRLDQQFRQQFLPGAQGSGKIYDFYRDRNRTLWIGVTNGVYAQKKGVGQPVHMPLQYKGEDISVTKFYKDPDGTMYFGTNYTLFRYDPLARSIKTLPDAANDKVMGHIIESRVVSLIKDTIDNNPVLLASPYGHFLAYYDLVQQKWVSRLDSNRQMVSSFNLTDNLIRKIYRSNDGKIWMATNKEGLAAWEKKPQPYITYYKNNPADTGSISGNHVFDITDAGQGNLWVSTYGGGLHYFNIATKKFRHIASSSNLLEGICTDSSGSVWMISGGNLHNYNPATDMYYSYELPDIERSGGVSGYLYKDEEGMMYAGGNNYFIAFHPRDIKKELTTPGVIITDFRVFNRSRGHLLFGNRIRLKHNQNFFTIEFASPYFSGTEKIHYSYMLEGVDKDWVDAGTRNFASYPNTGSGDFVFKVRAFPENGKPGDNIASIRITVIPPFWRTWWFYTLSVLLVTTAAYLLYRYRVNELMKRQAIRNKIAQDLHDNIGSTLSSISVYSQVAQIRSKEDNREEMTQVLDKISDTSNAMITEMNDIVWAINPANDNMEKIIRRMESFARPLLATRNIHFDFHCTEETMKLNLDMEKRKNFYLVFKEAVNNAIKYSGASLISVTIHSAQHHLSLVVKDNGVGFNPELELAGRANNPGGNGLRNMYARAKELKGHLEIDTGIGKGTRVSLRLPLG